MVLDELFLRVYYYYTILIVGNTRNLHSVDLYLCPVQACLELVRRWWSSVLQQSTNIRLLKSPLTRGVPLFLLFG